MTDMTDMTAPIRFSVAEAKARFSELLDRASHGEQFVVVRHGRPMGALIPPEQLPSSRTTPVGLAAVAGALAEWEDLPAVVEDIYAARLRSKERGVPEME
jgi:prevent-host-death family protein